VTYFSDLQEYMAIPRIERLVMSPDGRRLVALVKTLSPDHKKYVTALWEVDPDGVRPAHRLTRSAAGESGPAFCPDGTLLFVSARPDAEAAKDGKDGGAKDTGALWALPAAGGEASCLARRPGGIGGPVVARDAGTVVFAAATLPGRTGTGTGTDTDTDTEADTDEAERRKQRTDAGVSAILHEDLPIRFWDHQLGPDEPHLFVLGDDAHDLTPHAGQALVDQSASVTPDGSAVVAGWSMSLGRGELRSELTVIDCATGSRRTLLAREGTDFTTPVISTDGRVVACLSEVNGSITEASRKSMWLVHLDGSAPRDVLADLELWPGTPVWAPDAATIYFGADQLGRHPVFALDVATASVRQVTHDDAAYTDVSVSPDGRVLYALRSSIGSPPAPVRIDASTGDVTVLDAPGGSLTLPGRVTEISAPAPDGTEIRGWLVLPEAAKEPVPLLLWVHGGPFSSWNAWSWRWNPWIMAANGYAVLLPDPALSTGYGQDHLRRALANWGEVTFDDLMAITDAALARDDIDQARTAMMGGSFGGYMANWIAGHTDRFGAIVSHASLWKLELMLTSDEGFWFTRDFGDPAEDTSLWEANDPARHAGKIRTPMLVIHGDKDYRVPIGNGLWLWWDLVRNQVDAKFLYYPDENHWVLTPGNAVVWYETVLAFLAQHVLGEPWRRPANV
jgi:dipeptidyl aminopeptidase/acylaminoacyl peptidase